MNMFSIQWGATPEFNLNCFFTFLNSSVILDSQTQGVIELTIVEFFEYIHKETDTIGGVHLGLENQQLTLVFESGISGKEERKNFIEKLEISLSEELFYIYSLVDYMSLNKVEGTVLMRFNLSYLSTDRYLERARLMKAYFHTTTIQVLEV